MYSSDFDGSAAFAGGGFMPSQATQHPDSTFSPSKNRDARSLLPLTVKQIKDLQASSDVSSFSIDGVDVNNVMLVGRVCNKDERNITEVVFLLDDGTGLIECTRWVHERIDSNEVGAISVGMYARVLGHMRSLLNKKILNAFSIRPVMDFNEIPAHFIECIYVHLFNTRLRGGVTSQPQMTNSTLSTPSKGYQANPSNQFYGQHSGGGVKRVEEMIKDFLEQPLYLNDNGEYSNGIHRDVIAQQLNIPVERIIDPLTFLVNEGDIYTTSDDFHFKSARNG
ncbi:RPA_C domain-containing protein [Cephalotus follicularis]|uniref:RPA_C domain-containing protein n=1 Tax=Cephalotus follicularis TaxID=3775 RepID=A0A1Q3DBG3_CEPFO|nr:RPA_C domain-containing protein [Cephalotus follicularis]